jgi:predicted RNA-binding protein YlxR (DUF448 family)
MSRFGGAPHVGAPPRNTTCCASHAALTPDKSLFDPHQRLPGRGAYLCPNAACFRLAIKRKSLERALKTKVDASVLDTALAYLSQGMR